MSTQRKVRGGLVESASSSPRDEMDVPSARTKDGLPRIEAGSEIDALIDAYMPRQAGSGWTDVAAPVREMVRRAAPATRKVAMERLRVASQYFLWARSQGHPPLASTLNPPMIDAFTHQRRAVRSELTAHQDRIGLFALHRELHADADALRRQPGRQLATAPLSADELRAVRGSILAQPTRHREMNHRAIVALTAGCGLQAAELAPARVDDITDDGPDGLTVLVGSRTVWCAPEWEDSLRTVLRTRRAEHDPHLIAYSGDRSKLVPYHWMRHSSRHGVAISPQRLRTTWIVALIDTGAPLPVIMQASGLAHASALEPYLRHAATPAPELGRSFMLAVREQA